MFLILQDREGGLCSLLLVMFGLRELENRTTTLEEYEPAYNFQAALDYILQFFPWYWTMAYRHI